MEVKVNQMKHNPLPRPQRQMRLKLLPAPGSHHLKQHPTPQPLLNAHERELRQVGLRIALVAGAAKVTRHDEQHAHRARRVLLDRGERLGNSEDGAGARGEVTYARDAQTGTAWCFGGGCLEEFPG